MESCIGIHGFLCAKGPHAFEVVGHKLHQAARFCAVFDKTLSRLKAKESQDEDADLQIGRAQKG